ncbi:N-acetyltransferase family protein [Bdellovibrio sp. HCB337]|uniref:GNAT family N-acetyltransferase n=1 Tax=Bdellovibrio sp. HCB337 TaxID=3394358 RepID=UPI0039A69D24
MALFEARSIALKNGKTITLRPVLPDEAEAFLAAFLDILADSPYVLSTRESAAKKKTVETQRKWIEDNNNNPRALLLIAEDQGRIVGISNMLGFDGKRFHRGGFGMSIHKDYRGQGLGEALLGTLIDLSAQIEGLRYLELNVMKQNEAAYKLYQKFNFKEVGFLPGAYQQPDGSYTDDISMYLEL